MALLERATGITLRYGVYASIAILTVGLVLLPFDNDIGEAIITIGVTSLILTPFFSIISSTVALHMEGDVRWMRVSLMVLVITSIGILVAFFI